MTRFVSISITLLLLLAGCQPAPPRPPAPRYENSHQIYQLEKHRAAFEAYATGDRSEAVKADLRPTGMRFWPEAGKSGLVQFEWPSQDLMPALDDFNPILLYCPNGVADLPADFWTNDRKYLHPYQIDDHWFAAKRSWMSDPPPPRP